LKKWLHAVTDGSEDPKLAAAYNNMEDALHKLGETVGIANLRVTIVMDEKVTRYVASAMFSDLTTTITFAFCFASRVENPLP
jgi:hypothetical protein